MEIACCICSKRVVRLNESSGTRVPPHPLAAEESACEPALSIRLVSCVLLNVQSDINLLKELG